VGGVCSAGMCAGPLRSLLTSEQCLRYHLERVGKEHLLVTPDKKTETNQELLMSSIERVVIVSASFQSFVMTLRSISHWEYPTRSAICMVIYFICLFYSQLTRAAVRKPRLPMLILTLHRSSWSSYVSSTDDGSRQTSTTSVNLCNKPKTKTAQCVRSPR
jgi:hypothetical protein